MIGAIILLCLLMVLVYRVVMKPFSHWKDKNVKTPKVIPFFGENFKIVFGLESIAEQTRRLYSILPNERYYGTYQFSTPVLVLRSPDLIKKICVKDSDYFFNRRDNSVENTDVLFTKALVNRKGQSWKEMRSTLSPTFTSSKMKTMFVMICHTAKLFTDYFLDKNEKIVEVELKEAISRFTSDVITNAAFGIEVDSLKDRDNTFYKIGREGINFGGQRMTIAFFLYQLSPKIASLLKISMMDKKTQDLFIKLVRESIEMREEQNIKRSDIVGLLLEAKTRQKKEVELPIVKEYSAMKRSSSDSMNLTDEDIAAQVFILFFAGFEAMATLISFIAYELAVNIDIQQKLIAEVDKNWPDNDLPSYNEVMNMTYLDMVVSEALRKWPNGIVTDRVVTKEYTIEPELPGEKPLTLEEGSLLVIPIAGIHFDPTYYPNPEKFDPERFSPENRSKREPYTYLPFGAGPRKCIGSRFTLMEVKAIIFHILHKFELVPIGKTQIPMKCTKNAFGFFPKNGFHIGLKRRDI